MLTAQTKNTQTLMPLTERVNVQADSARINQIIDGCWVAVGTNKPHAIQRDFTNLFDGKPSYRFELKTEDNTLEGYAKVNPEKPYVPLNKNDAFQKVQKRRVQKKR